MTKISLNGFVAAAGNALNIHEAQQARENAAATAKQAQFDKEAADINAVFKPLVDALTSLPPGKDGKRFKADIMHLYPTELVVAYIGEDWTLMSSSPALGRMKPRQGFAITGGGDKFTVKDMTTMNDTIYSSVYNQSPEEALTFIGGILPRIAPERTQEMVAAVARAYGRTGSPGIDGKPQPTL